LLIIRKLTVTITIILIVISPTTINSRWLYNLYIYSYVKLSSRIIRCTQVTHQNKAGHRYASITSQLLVRYTTYQQTTRPHSIHQLSLPLSRIREQASGQCQVN